MAIDNFTPEIWSNEILHNLNKAHVYAQDSVTNRDYEGEISEAGDKVKINSIGRVTVKTYTKNGTIDAPDTLTDAQRELVIDQQKYFNFEVDDIDKAQSKPKVMSEAMGEAAYSVSDVEDQFLAALHTGADSANLIGNDVTPEANRAVTELLAKALGVPKAKVRILSGVTSRLKQVAVDGDPKILGDKLRAATAARPEKTKD